MKFRKLQIAWSVGWGAVAVLLCVLWGRSYWVVDCFSFSISNTACMDMGSVQGMLGFDKSDSSDQTYYRHTAPHQWEQLQLSLYSSIFGGVVRNTADQVAAVFVAYWPLVLGSTFLFTLPLIRLRFSLRTLLIATTLAAVLLGIIVWLSRAG